MKDLPTQQNRKDEAKKKVKGKRFIKDSPVQTLTEPTAK